MKLQWLSSKPVILILVALTLTVIGINTWLWWQRTYTSIPAGSLPKPSLAPTVDQPFLKYTFIGEIPDLGKEAHVYALKTETILTLDIANDWAKTFAFTPPPTSLEDVGGTVYLYSQPDGSSLLVYPQPIRLEYTNGQVAKKETVSREAVLKAAQVFIDEKIPDFSEFKLGNPDITPMKVGFEQVAIEADSEAEAEFYRITYDLLLEKVPVISKDRQVAAFVLFADLDGNIRKATLTILPNQITTMGKTPIATVAEAVEGLNHGLGTLTNLTNPKVDYTTLSGKDISQANLTSAQLILLLDADTDTMQPFYRFRGTARTASQQTIRVEALITALPQAIFQSPNP